MNQEMKAAARAEQHARVELERVEADCRARLDAQDATLKEARRNAVQQVTEVTSRGQHMNEEMDRLMHEVNEARSERTRLAEEVQKLESELHMKNQEHDTWVSKVTREVATVKKENVQYQVCSESAYPGLFRLKYSL